MMKFLFFVMLSMAELVMRESTSAICFVALDLYQSIIALFKKIK